MPKPTVRQMLVRSCMVNYWRRYSIGWYTVDLWAIAGQLIVAVARAGSNEKPSAEGFGRCRSRLPSSEMTPLSHSAKGRSDSMGF